MQRLRDEHTSRYSEDLDALKVCPSCIGFPQTGLRDWRRYAGGHEAEAFLANPQRVLCFAKRHGLMTLAC